MGAKVAARVRAGATHLSPSLSPGLSDRCILWRYLCPGCGKGLVIPDFQGAGGCSADPEMGVGGGPPSDPPTRTLWWWLPSRRRHSAPGFGNSEAPGAQAVQHHGEGTVRCPRSPGMATHTCSLNFPTLRGNFSEFTRGKI